MTDDIPEIRYGPAVLERLKAVLAPEALQAEPAEDPIETLRRENRELAGQIRGLEADRRLLHGALLLLEEAGIEVGSSDLIKAADLAEAERGAQNAEALPHGGAKGGQDGN